MSGIAYRSAAPAVTAAWIDYQAGRQEVVAKRKQIRERYGRGLMLNRLGFGHGTRVTGFEVLEGDEPGALVGENGEIRIPARRFDNVAKPNVRRKAGKELAAELATLNEKGPSLPGMPEWQLVGLSSLAPGLFEDGGTIWAYWGEDISATKTGGEVDLTLWEAMPLSAYYAVVEAREQVSA